jgi:hypothetical protein
VTGRVRVHEGSRLLIRGQIAKDVIVQNGAVAFVRGVVTGKVAGSGRIFIAVGAHVNNRALSSTGAWETPSVTAVTDDSTIFEFEQGRAIGVAPYPDWAS